MKKYLQRFARLSQKEKKKNPSFAYSINRNPLLLMLNVLPRRMQLWAIKLVLR